MATDQDAEAGPRLNGRTAHSERVLASLLLPAAAMIREKGIVGASVEDLVNAVGVSKGTLYYHIRTKEGLLYWIHESVTDEGYARWERAIEETEGAPATMTLERMIEEHCAVIHEYRDCVAVISEEMKYLPPDLQHEIRVRRAQYQGLLESVLARGMKSGEFARLPQRLTASMMIGTLNSMYRWYDPAGPQTPEELAAMAKKLLLRGLRG